MTKIKFKNANKEQLLAIKTVEGPLLIIAGPGTGKTYTLINRTLNLIINYKVDPSEIFLATFTEKAANELKSRLSSELSKRHVDVDLNGMLIGTFHSICLKILKENIEFTNLSKNFSLYDEFDQKYFIYRHYNEFKEILDFDSYICKGTLWDQCEDIVKIVDRLKEELVDCNELMNSRNCAFKFYGKLITKYEQLKKKYNFVDFSSIQVDTYEMLLKNPDLLLRIQNKIKYVMVDEYQDTNHIQEKLTMMFGAKRNNICVVGDDDQAIYRFRGATVRNILEFPLHFKNTTKVTLTKNYRSNSSIIDFYNNWMETTTGRDFKFEWKEFRYKKNIEPAKKDTSRCSSIMRLTTKEESFINKKILSFINKLKSSKTISDYNQIAFLFRSVKNDDVVNLAKFLEFNNINVYSPRSNMFFQREEIQLFIGCMIYMFPKYMIFLQSADGEKIALRKYYFTCILTAQEHFKKHEFYELSKFVGEKAKQHLYIKRNLDYAFSGLAYRLLEFEPFRTFATVDLAKGITDSRCARNIGIFINLLIKYESLNQLSVFTTKNIDIVTKRLFNQYFRFLNEGGISEYEDNEEYAPSGCISFLTIHQSKGLEFPVVIVGSQSSVPRKQYDEDLENVIALYSGRGSFEPIDKTKYFDFWRLFYVAFSRAQSLLVLLADESKNNEPSKYFESLYKELPYEYNFDDFDFEKIKISNNKRNYSFTSDINAYQVCPTQYMFYNILGYGSVRGGAALFGTIVHETIEDINKAVIAKQFNLITDKNINDWFNINYSTASKQNNVYLNDLQIKVALQQAINYKNKIINQLDSIHDAELPISISNNEYDITGKVDLIIKNDGRYSIVDFKTEKKPNLDKEKEKIERVRSQLEVYAYIIEKRYNIKVDSLKVFYTSELDSNPYINFDRDQKHINDTMKMFNLITRRIEEKDFNHKCNDMRFCANCDLRFYCKRGK